MKEYIFYLPFSPFITKYLCCQACFFKIFFKIFNCCLYLWFCHSTVASILFLWKLKCKSAVLWGSAWIQHSDRELHVCECVCVRVCACVCVLAWSVWVDVLQCSVKLGFWATLWPLSWSATSLFPSLSLSFSSLISSFSFKFNHSFNHIHLHTVHTRKIKIDMYTTYFNYVYAVVLEH